MGALCFEDGEQEFQNIAVKPSRLQFPLKTLPRFLSSDDVKFDVICGTGASVM